MYGYIYETLCILTGKKYIGMHRWPKDSIDPNYFGSGIHLQRALSLYGKDNFSCRILEWCETREELLEREKFYISEVQAPINDDYYNIEDGGQGGHNEFYVQPVTQNQLNALEYGRHLPASEKQREQLSRRRKNIIVSNETRKKLSKAAKGKKVINDGQINKCVSEDELERYLALGWKLGKILLDVETRTEKFKKTHYSKDNIEWKKNISKAVKGRRWITNGVINKQVSPDDLETYFSEGFYFGRSSKK